VHFLCYGSLFGQIRQSASLPWEKDAELCVLNEEISQYDEVFMKRLFWKQGLDIFYDSAEGR
jgi:phosphorylcholine metabolism protein LicD